MSKLSLKQIVTNRTAQVVGIVLGSLLIGASVTAMMVKHSPGVPTVSKHQTVTPVTTVSPPATNNTSNTSVSSGQAAPKSTTTPTPQPTPTYTPPVDNSAQIAAAYQQCYDTKKAQIDSDYATKRQIASNQHDAALASINSSYPTSSYQYQAAVINENNRYSNQVAANQAQYNSNVANIKC